MNAVTRIGSVFALVSVLVAGLAPAGWAQWRVAVGGNEGRDGRAGVVGPSAPTLAWQGSLSGIVAQQGVSDGSLVVVNRIASFAIPTGTWIVAHDVQTGAIQWQVQLPASFPDSWRSRVTGIDGGRVYATRSGNTNAEYLYALGAANGATVWKSQDLIIESTTESLTYASNGDPITTGRVNGQTVLLRIDAPTGATVWSTPRTCPTTGGCDAAVFGNRVYAFEAGGAGGGPRITVFDGTNGQRLYSSPPITQGFIQQVGPFVGPDGTVYAPRTQNNPTTDFLVAFTDTGSALVQKWQVPIGYVPFASHAVGPDGSVYTVDPSLALVRLDPATGAVVDTTAPLPADFPAQPRLAVDASGKLFLTNGGFGQGRLTVFTKDLKEIWSETIPNVNVGGPVLAADGTLIVCGVGTDVRAYSESCAGYSTPFGEGCIDGAGAVPTLGTTGCPTPGGALTIDLAGASPGAFALLLLGLGDGVAAFDATCSIGVLPVLPSVVAFNVPGSGAATLPATVPGGLPPVDVNLQVLIADPTAPAGTAATRPLRVHVE